MIRPNLLLFSALFLCALLGAADDVAAEEYTTLRFHVETGAQGYSGGVASVGQLTARYRFTPRLYLDIVGKSGQLFARSSYDNQLYLALGAGAGISTGEAPNGWEFRFSPRVTHVHHASTDSWRETPLSNLAGDSDGGVQHRSGVELAAGVTGPQFGSFRSRRFLWSADLLVDFLPSSDEMEFGVGAVVGISLTGHSP